MSLPPRSRSLATSIALALTLAACASSTPALAAHDDPFHALHAPAGAVDARLARFRAPALAWSTPLGALTATDVRALCSFEQTSVSPHAVRVACPSGQTVTVGATGGFCDGDALEDAHVIGDRCAMTVGELVACELALREDPCAIGRASLPECTTFDACRAQLAAEAALASR
jgi:hypothetical protein